MLIEKVQELILTAGERYGDQIAPQVLIFAAAAQTLHMPPEQAAAAFEEARRRIANSGSADHIHR